MTTTYDSDTVSELRNLPALMSVIEDDTDAEAVRLVGSVLDINKALPGLVKHEPTALLLDNNNLFRRALSSHFKLDYGSLKAILEQRCDLRFAAAFSALDYDDPNSAKWVSYMKEQGYYVDVKELKRYTTPKGVPVSKGNMDIELTLAALDLSESFTHVIIGSCDGDFVPLVNRLRRGNCRKVSVLGITNPDRTGMSEALIRSANNFYDLRMIKDYVSYRSRYNG